MRAILSVQREDGKFPEVGTTNRWVEAGTANRIRRQAVLAARHIGRPVRVEFFAETIYADATRVEEVR